MTRAHHASRDPLVRAGRRIQHHSGGVGPEAVAALKAAYAHDGLEAAVAHAFAWIAATTAAAFGPPEVAQKAKR